MRSIENIKAYYQEITSLDIGAVARELMPERITEATARVLYVNCPKHESTSGRSLHISIDKQQWICRAGCGSGDVLQLVELYQSGEITKGHRGAMPKSHRDARDWLAKRCNLPLLGDIGLTAREIEARELQRFEEERVRCALTALSELYNEALFSPSGADVRKWLAGRYPITEDTYKRLLVGWVPLDDWEDSARVVRKAAQYELMGTGSLSDQRMEELGAPYSPAELLATGAFYGDKFSESTSSAFAGRVWFPYWSRGAVVYAIGREIPQAGGEPRAKYKKLQTRGEDGKNFEFVSSHVQNNVLWGEDCLLSEPPWVIQTEGITDAITLEQAGFPVFSPVTTKARDTDWPVFVKRLKKSGTREVLVVQDNEISEAGLRGALATAEHLEPEGITVKVVELTLDEPQVVARARLSALGITPGQTPAERKLASEKLTAAERGEVPTLLEAAKQDVASYFRTHTVDEFKKLLDGALSPIELAINQLPDTYQEAVEAADPIFEALVKCTPLETNRVLKVLQLKLGRKQATMSDLREMVAKKRRGVMHELESPDSKSCKRLVEQTLRLYPADTVTGHTQAATAAFEWFARHGGRFFRTPRGEPFLYWQPSIYWLDASEKTSKRALAAMLFDQTGLVVDCTTGGRVFTSTLASLTHTKGETRETFKWVHTDIVNKRVWLPLGNTEQQIVRIDENGVEVMPNGDNRDGVILSASEQMKGFDYEPDVLPAELDAKLDQHFTKHFTCTWSEDRDLLTQWACVYGLLEFAGTRPILRAEGAQQSGKTTASKLLSVLVDGNEAQHKISSAAANFVDAANNPLLVRDNIEVADFGDDFRQFLLTSAGGIVKQKRAGNTDSGLVQERARCIVFHSGIEPVGAELPELLSRTLVLHFSKEAKTPDGFNEQELLAELEADRARILSGLFARWSRMLRAMRAGVGKRILALFQKTLGSHSKSRCNDYLMLMYLFSIIDDPDMETWIATMRPSFEKTMRRLIADTEQTAHESAQLAGVLAAVFASWRAARASTDASIENNWRAKYATIRFESAGEWEGKRTLPLTVRGLFTGLRLFAHVHNLPFKYKNPIQMGCRLANELDTIEQAGFAIEKGRNQHGNTYVITQLIEDIPSEAPRRIGVARAEADDDARNAWARDSERG